MSHFCASWSFKRLFEVILTLPSPICALALWQSLRLLPDIHGLPRTPEPCAVGLELGGWSLADVGDVAGATSCLFLKSIRRMLQAPLPLLW